MPDYSKSIIYKITCNITGKIYIGSTCQPIKKRLSVHKWEAKRLRNDLCKSGEIINNGNYTVSIVENCNVTNKHELHLREKHHILNTPNVVNKYIPANTRKEYRDKYYSSEEMKQKKKEWANKYARRVREERRNNKVYCEYCQLSIACEGVKRHERSLSHIKSFIMY